MKTKAGSSPVSAWGRKPDWILAAAVCLGLIIRAVLVIFRQYAISFDEAHHLRLAGSFLQQGFGGLMHPYWPPLYPAVTAAAGLIVKNLETAGRLVNILCSTGIGVLVYIIAGDLFNKHTARLAAVFALLYPPLAFESTEVVTEPLYSVLGIGGMLLFYRGIINKKPGRLVLAGLLWGGSYLVRPEGVGFMMVAAAFITAAGLVRLLRIRFSQAVLWVAAVCIGFIAAASPYLIYLRNETGQWTLSTKGMVNQQLEAAVAFDSGKVKDPFFHLTEDNRHLPVDMAYHFGNIQDLVNMQEGSQRIVHIGLRQYAEKYVRNVNGVLKEALPRVMTAVLLILATAGFIANFYSRKNWILILFTGATIFFFWFGVVPMFHVNYRYLLPLFPLCLIWSAHGAIHLYTWGEKAIAECASAGSRFSRWRKKISGILVAGIIILVCFVLEAGRIFAIHKYTPGLWGEPVEIREAGLWLKNNTDHAPVLLSINKAADFYAGQYNMKLGASFSYDSIDRIIAYARYRQCEYMVFSSRYLAWFANCEPLMSPEKMPAETKLVYDRTGPDGVRTVIYKL